MYIVLKKKMQNDDTFRHTQTINPKLIFFIYDLFKTNLNQFFYYQTLSFEEKYWLYRSVGPLVFKKDLIRMTCDSFKHKK